MAMPDSSDQRYTLEDWKTWDGQWELIDGKAYNMTPGARMEHQFTSIELAFCFKRQLDRKNCRVYGPPADVFLSDDSTSDEQHVVQPDIMIICDRSRIKSKGIIGPPTLIVEVLSLSTQLKDYNAKYNLYERSGVQEYWIVHPIERTVRIYTRIGDRFGEERLFTEGVATSGVFPEISVELSDIFEDYA